jgi:hypothetical protein
MLIHRSLWVASDDEDKRQSLSRGRNPIFLLRSSRNRSAPGNCRPRGKHLVHRRPPCTPELCLHGMLRLPRIARLRTHYAFHSARHSHFLSRANQQFYHHRHSAVFVAGACASLLTATAAAGLNWVYADYDEVHSDDREEGPELLRSKQRTEFVEQKLRENYTVNEQLEYDNNGIKYSMTVLRR